jgi:hypothetical protein
MKFRILILFIVFFQVAFSGIAGNISTGDALAKFKDKLGENPFFAFVQVREQPLKWFDSIPENCIVTAINQSVVKLYANPGEQFVFQIGVWALEHDLDGLKLEFQSMKSKQASIDSQKFTCFNSEGSDFKGNHFFKTIHTQAGRVQALWIGVDLENVSEGEYNGTIKVSFNGNIQEIPLSLQVLGEKTPNHGYDCGAKLSRLNWLNSTVGIDENVTQGFIPVQREKNRISILGRSVLLAESGLPSVVTSFFNSSNEQLSSKGEPIVNQSFQFIIEKENGEVLRLKAGRLTFTQQVPARICWKVVNTSPEADLECSGQMEFDGFIDYKLKLTPKVPLKVKDIRLEIPFSKEKAEYMMGLGHEGGIRTPDWKWKWDVSKNQDMLWLGAVNGGMRIKWKAENYTRPLVNIYYEFGPLEMPRSWGNEGKGGVEVTEKDKEVIVNAYSGSRELEPGVALNYDFELLVTPLKLIDRNIKFNDRYYHGGGPDTSVKIANAQKAGANIINIHHAEDIYPFINYPYIDANVKELKQLVASAHKENLRMKFYYTTRELTKNLPEFWAFNSLNGEVIFPGPGNSTRTEALHPNGPNEWLIKNLREKYIPAWYNLVKEGKFKGEMDLSVITTPDSRLNNFYVAGLDWMVRNIGIDGVYIDDSALDRFTLQRARKVIDNNREAGRIDMHSWNHFCKWAGFANCLNLYMDLLPYVDLVWIGEGRNYDRLPDHWLIEVSGIPFGLPGQMLEGGGNPWRGMVYGITTRAGWTSNPPTNLWKFFDEYHFSERNLDGYWQKDCRVTCSDTNIKASVYKGKQDAVIAVANWSDRDEETDLILDAAALGLKGDCTFSIPEISDFQQNKTLSSLKKITIPAKKGFLIVVKKK